MLPTRDQEIELGPFSPFKLNGELAKILAQKDVREKLVGQGADPEHTTPEQFSAYIKSETAKWGKVIKEANIQAE